MLPRYKSPFVRFVKKQHRPLQLAIEGAVEEICRKPQIGEAKSGDLLGFRVFKFTHKKQEYLVAYRPPTDQEFRAQRDHRAAGMIDFYLAGTHENFYSDLKNYLKS